VTPTAWTTPALFALGQGALTLGVANAPLGPNLLNAPQQGFDDGKHLIVADTGNNRILIWNSVPSISGTSADLVLGQSGSFYTRSPGTDASSGSNSYLSSPKSIFSDGTRLFVADSGNHRVLVWTTFPTTSTTGPTFALGQSSLVATSSSATSSGLKSPAGVFADTTNLYISDTGNERLMIYPLSTLLKSGTSGQSAAYALGAINNNSVGYGIGQYGFTPYGIYSDGHRLIVGDPANNRTLIWKSIPTNDSTPADLVLGQPGFYSNGANFNSDGSSGTTAQSASGPHWPTLINGKLYVADTGNHRVLVWSIFPVGSSESASSVLGQSSFFSSNLNLVNLSSTTFNSPYAVSSYVNQLLITDTNNNRILFSPQ
jgi:hypothetical protein